MPPDKDILSGFSIRPLRAEDLDEVIKIEKASFSNPWHREQFASELRNPVSRAYAFRLPSGGNEVLGAYMVYWVVHGEAHILNIAVNPKFRGKGIARKFLAEALEMMRYERVYEVFLEVRRSNSAARSLYRSFGFREVYERKGYYGDEDAIVMTLTF